MEKHEKSLKMRTSDYFAFSMYQQYSGIKCFAVLFINAFIIYCLITRWNLYGDTARLLLIFGLFLFDIYMPFQLFLKAKSQVAQLNLDKEETIFAFSADGLEVSKGENRLGFKWGHFLKYKTFGKRTFIYTSRITAFIIARDLVGEDTYNFILQTLKDNRSVLGSLSIQTVEQSGGEENDEQ